MRKKAEPNLREAIAAEMIKNIQIKRHPKCPACGDIVPSDSTCRKVSVRSDRYDRLDGH